MSLYYEASTLLFNADNVGGSLKSRVCGNKSLKSSPAQVYALLTEATKWSSMLKDVIERSELLKVERKLTPALALLLTHDLLLSKNGVSAAANHPLRLAVERHKARLRAELQKIRVKLGYSNLEALRTAIDSGTAPGSHSARNLPTRPRWVRINTLRTTLQDQLSSTFSGYSRAAELSEVLASSRNEKILFLDTVIPNLLALPPNADVSTMPAYVSGALFIQDKASCFPALLLDPRPTDGHIIDACAAPGNKTTHLAALISASYDGLGHDALRSCIIAFERDAERAVTLSKMVKRAGATSIVELRAATDFLAVDPRDPGLAKVGALLLDPSCSGSGIVGRDEDDSGTFMALPERSTSQSETLPRRHKRKRKGNVERNEPAIKQLVSEEPADAGASRASDARGSIEARLEALSSFQLTLLKHAMSFPAARKIVYSTCSEHWIENEGVVLRALASSVAKERGWRVLRRSEQRGTLEDWSSRGQKSSTGAGVEIVGANLEMLDEDTLESCVRCEKGNEQGTIGFFVVGFVRDPGPTQKSAPRKANDDENEPIEIGADDEEWDGFSDSSNG